MKRSHFYGMSLREIRGMPMTLDATWMQLGILDSKKVASSIGLAQERYVRQVWIACPRWKWRKKAKLREALDHAERITNAILCKVLLPPIRATQDWEQHEPLKVTERARRLLVLDPGRTA